MITADQLLAHALGDYIFQSHWMATEKTKRSLACLAHVATYLIPFMLLFRKSSWLALVVIAASHFVIDRWRLARWVVFVKNAIGAPSFFYRPKGRVILYMDEDTGYYPETPAWLAVWLLIIADNIIHVCINGLALRYL